MAKFVRLREDELAEIEKERLQLEEQATALKTVRDSERESEIRKRLQVAEWKAKELQRELALAAGNEGAGGKP